MPTLQEHSDYIFEQLFNSYRPGIAWHWGYKDRVSVILRDLKMFLPLINDDDALAEKRELLFWFIKIMVEELLNPPYEDALFALRLLKGCQKIQLSEKTQKEIEKMMGEISKSTHDRYNELRFSRFDLDF